MRRAQLSFGDGLIAEEVSDLRDHWMTAAEPSSERPGSHNGRVRRWSRRHPKSRSRKNEAAAKAKGVKRVCIPDRSTKSRERRR